MPLLVLPDIEIINKQLIGKTDIKLSLIGIGLCMVPVFYYNYVRLFPRIAWTKNYRKLFVSQLIGLVVVSIASELLQWLVQGHRPFVPAVLPAFHYLVLNTVGFTIVLVRRDMLLESQRKEQETENLRAELQFLKWQVSPHFLFNVLNSLVAMAHTKSDKLEDSLHTLSSMMRYMLYESDEQVSISQECEYLESFVALQQLRYSKGVKLVRHFDHHDAQELIEPMLLIPFVENAFKHGTAGVSEPEIHLLLSYNNITGVLLFSVKNKVPAKSLRKSGESGLGLQNVQKRLKLLYEGKHQLHIHQTEAGWYEVMLEIDLK